MRSPGLLGRLGQAKSDLHKIRLGLVLDMRSPEFLGRLGQAKSDLHKIGMGLVLDMRHLRLL